MCEEYSPSLPPEILINIFKFLNFYDLQAVKLCCKQWLAVTMLPEFNSQGVFKITSGILDSNHPAVEILLNKKPTNLYLKGVYFVETDELLQHIGSFLNTLTLKLVPFDVALPLTMKYFTKLRYLKVSNLKLASLIGNIKELHSGSLSQINELVLTANDSKVNKYLLDSVKEASSLKVLTIEFTYQDETNLLSVLANHSHSLIQLNLRYYGSISFSHLKWSEVIGKLKLDELSLQGNFHSDILRRSIETQKSLQVLDFKGSVAVDDNCLFNIGTQLSQLRKLVLTYCGLVTNEGINQLKRLSNLKILNLTGCNRLTSLSISGIIGQAPNVTLLELHLQDVNIDESDVCMIANSIPNLKIFNLSGCGKAVTDKSIQEIFDCQRNLQTLKIDNCKLTDEGILGLATGNSIQDLEKLDVLSLRGCKNLTDLSITSGLRFPQLKFLDISHCDLITHWSLEQLAKNCPTIEEICITSSKNMDHTAIQTLTAELGRLRLVSVDNCHDISQIGANNWIQSKYRPSTSQVTLKRCTKLSMV